MNAIDFIARSADVLSERAEERGLDDERSMPCAVAMFNGLTSGSMSEREGNLFMVCLKLARAQQGNHDRPDDYVDAIGYTALAGEVGCAKAESSRLKDDEMSGEGMYSRTESEEKFTGPAHQEWPRGLKLESSGRIDGMNFMLSVIGERKTYYSVERVMQIIKALSARRGIKDGSAHVDIHSDGDATVWVGEDSSVGVYIPAGQIDRWVRMAKRVWRGEFEKLRRCFPDLDGEDPAPEESLPAGGGDDQSSDALEWPFGLEVRKADQGIGARFELRCGDSVCRFRDVDLFDLIAGMEKRCEVRGDSWRWSRCEGGASFVLWLSCEGPELEIVTPRFSLVEMDQWVAMAKRVWRDEFQRMKEVFKES